jgi:PAS domain S-box-containing protein
MNLVMDGPMMLVAAVSLLAGVVAIALALLAIGALRRAVRRQAAAVRDLRRHAMVGELPLEGDPAVRGLTLELNHLLDEMRGQVRVADARRVELQALADGPPDLALVGTDAEWRVVSFNRGAVALTAWPADEILHHHVEALFAGGEWERILPKLSRRSLREVGIVEKVRLLRRDGGEFPAQLAVGRPAAAGGGPLLLAARDLSEEQALEKRLRESEARYRRLVEGIGDGVFIVKGGQIAYANPALARILGAEKESLVGTPFKDLIEARDLLRVLEIFETAETGGEAAGEMSCQLASRDRAAVEARVAWATIQFEGERAIIGTIADRTERARFERALSESEGRLRATLESTGDGILVLGSSPRGREVTLVNRAFCEPLGLFHEQLPGMPEAELRRALLSRCADPDRLQDFFEALSSGAEGRLDGVEITLPRRAVLDLGGGPIRDASGEAPGTILTIRDVTARVDAERALRRSLDELSRAKTELESAYADLGEAQKAVAQRNEQLERLNAELKSLDEMKSNLLANVSHELHTPLVSIKGYTEMILKRRLGPLTPEQERGLEVALKNIDRLIEMIDNLLSFSRMEQGETQLNLETVPLWQIVDEAVELVAERIRKRNLSVTTQYETDDLAVRADRVKIGQVLTNLLTNSVKFNRDGGRITLTARKGPRGYVEVVVADTGIGIPSEELDRIFERFHQVDSSPRRRYEGTGIGLSIVRDILRLHGCSIRVTSEPDRGSVFTFTLPLAHEPEPSETKPPTLRGQARG